MPYNFQPAFQRALSYHPFLQRDGTAEQRDRWAAVYNAVKLTAEEHALLASFRRKMPVLCLSGIWCGDCVNACPIFQRFAEACPLIDLRFIHRAQKFDATPVKAVDEGDIRHKPIGKILVKWGILTPERIEKALLVQEESKAKGLNAKIGDVLTEMGEITAAQRDEALAHQAGFGNLADADRELAMELSICGGPRVPVLVFLSEDGFECARYGERTLATYRDKILRSSGASCPTGLFSPAKDLLAENVAQWLEQFERIQWMLATSPRLMKLHGEI